MGRKKTNEEFIKEVYDLVGDEYIFLEEYKGSKINIKCRHNKCSYIWEVKPSNFLKGTRCPECSNEEAAKKKALSYNEVKHFIEVESGCKLLSNDYINAHQKLKLKCKCGEIFQTTFNAFKHNHKKQCNRCGKQNFANKKTKTNKEFINEIYNIVGNEYIFLESYINSATKIKCKHNECGHIWQIRPNDFLKGNRCPKCYGNIPYTQEEYCNKIIEIAGDEYIFLEKYIDSKTKIKCKHNKCGYIWKTTPNNFLNGRRCPQCNGGIKYTYEEVKYFIEVESGSGCKLLNKEYTNSQTKLKIQCKCGEIFQTNFNKFKDRNQRQCKKCGYKKLAQLKKFAYIDVKKFIETESNSGCKLLSKKYKNAYTKLLLQCKCGKKFKTSFSEFKFQNKKQCNKCGRYISSKKRIKTQEQFEKEIYSLVGNEYVFLEEYIDVETKIKCRHNICGYEYKVTPNNFLHAENRCPRCAESRGERQIKKCLEDKNIKFEQEYYFDDLLGIGGGLLRFDFAILNNKNVLIGLIEYDGQQHFKQINFGGISDEEALINLEYQQQNDNIKNQYCKDNDINLLRIPYWEFDNIEKILEEWLSKYGLIHNENIKNVV